MKKLKPYLKIPITDFINEELEAQNWTKEYFVKISGIGAAKLDNLFSGKEKVTINKASKFSNVFGQSREYWLSLLKR